MTCTGGCQGRRLFDAYETLRKYVAHVAAKDLKDGYKMTVFLDSDVTRMLLGNIDAILIEGEKEHQNESTS